MTDTQAKAAGYTHRGYILGIPIYAAMIHTENVWMVGRNRAWDWLLGWWPQVALYGRNLWAYLCGDVQWNDWPIWIEAEPMS